MSSERDSKPKVLMAGGTIDKVYNELDGSLGFNVSNIPQMFEEANAPIPEYEVVMLNDSLDMTDADRVELMVEARDAQEDRIVITHGTDTMVETAKLIAEYDLDKTIVLTGAMRPYTFGKSDASFNLGFAFAAAQLLPHGIYVAMNGQVFKWDNVSKNKELGRFEPLE